MKKKNYVGTSGYMISEKKWWGLEKFNSLEVNYTFYRMPKIETWQKWYSIAPEGFVYSLKMSQYMTHKKKLLDAQEAWNRFWEGAQHLKDKLGVILLQFPPSFHNTDKVFSDGKTYFQRLQDLANVLPKDLKFAFEFRSTTWFCKEVYDFLKSQNWCLVNAFVENKGGFGDLPSGFAPQVKTADFNYVRFHGSAGSFKGSYSKEQLEEVQKFLGKDQLNFVYFNNTFFTKRSDFCMISEQKVNSAAVCDAAEFVDLDG